LEPSVGKGQVSADEQWVIAAEDSLQRLAEALPTAHAVMAAVCDDRGRARDLLVCGQAGDIRVLTGLPERFRPNLDWLLALAAGEDPSHVLRNAAAAHESAGWPYRDIVEARPLPVRAIDPPDAPETLASGCEYAGAIIDARDVPGLILDADDAFRTIVGQPGGDILGRSLFDVLGPANARPLREAIEDARGGRRQVIDIPLVSRAGTTRWLELTLDPNQDAAEGDRVMLGVRELAGRRATLRELQLTIDRLNEANVELGEFAGTTAHDLVGPLRAVTGLIDLIPIKDPETAELLAAIRSAIDRMESSIDGALGYAQARKRQSKGTVDLEWLVESVLDMLADEIAERQASVTVEELPAVTGDELQLERVFSNLIANALKFSAGPPVIHIDARREGQAWRISVADQGIGIEPGRDKRIFELFVRGPGSDELPGRGIGLATSRRIIESHGGRIWTEANTPQGSVFHFTLPDET
jgi:two-component system, chemotaxis family, sensor kinase Cph1